MRKLRIFPPFYFNFNEKIMSLLYWASAFILPKGVIKKNRKSHVFFPLGWGGKEALWSKSMLGTYM